MANKTSPCLFMAACLGTTGTAAALPLQDYVVEVVTTNPEVRQSVHRYQQVEQDYYIARKGWMPSLDLNGSTGAYATKSPATLQRDRDYSSNRATVTLTQNLFDGFDTTSQMQQNRARVSSALYQVMDQADTVALEAVKAYLDALRQKRLDELAADNVTAHERIFSQISERIRAGVGRRSEVDQTEGRLARARASLEAQHNNLQDALSRVHTYLGRYIDVRDLIEPERPALPEGDRDTLIARALERHPALHVAQSNTTAAKADYERSKSRYMPKVDLQLQKLVGDNIGGYEGKTDEHSVTLNLSYNLFNGGADRAEQQKRVSAIYENNDYEYRTRRQVIEQLRLALAAHTTLEQQVAFLDTHVKKAGEALEAYKQEFFLGRRDLTDVLDSESELNNAQKSLVQARYDLILAAYRVNEAMGNLFAAMHTDIAVGSGEIRFLKVGPGKADVLPYPTDRDADRVTDTIDQCDNSVAGLDVSANGCRQLPPEPVMTPPPPPPAPEPVVQAPPPPPPAEEKPAVFAAPLIAHLNFKSGKADLAPSSKKQLDPVIKTLKTVERAEIEVTAYTDSKGKADANMALSRRRADVVRALLIKAGLDGKHITSVGRGEENPIASNTSEEGRAKNRRVEFKVTQYNSP